MNSEELELSLRIEFESHLKSVLADMKQEFSAFQEKIEAEFDKHKSQLDAVFVDFANRLDTEKELEPGFAETVVEHLRLARDEGARITAMAFAEAEEMEKQAADAAAPTVGISEVRNAINDITAQNSQATILKALVHHAGQFTPRGAFFIIKNDHFVGWRVFGKEKTVDEEAVREVFLPVAQPTVLGESVRSLSAVESSFGTYDDDFIYLDKLQFGQPTRMIAIPLVARGRGVAVLYADYGTQGEEVNIEALETLVRVAGLTVEVLASSQGAKPAQYSQPAVVAESEAADDFQSDQQSEEAELSESGVSEDVSETEMPEETDYQTADEEDSAVEPVYASEEDSIEEVEDAEEISVEPEEVSVEAEETEETETEEESAWNQPSETVEQDDSETYQPVVSEGDYSAPEQSDYQFSETQSVEDSQFETADSTEFETAPFESAEEVSDAEEKSASFELADDKAESYDSEPVVTEVETAVSEPVSAKSSKTRFSDRNVDLPIEVGEDERRLHNDARRFARLLVSEIKLYNEQKVKEGREAQDLYERLREAIDRSRDMYDKRVQPPVAAKFDYFHYELVSSLAEGEETKLGGNYPGAVA